MKYKLFQPLAFKEAGKCGKQEDTIYPILDDATAEDRLFVVCDGMGGRGFGDVASRTVCKGITRGILASLTYDRPFSDEQFEKVVTSTYELLGNCAVNPEHKTGSTAAVVLFHRGGCMVAHIGNTAIYQLRPFSNEIIYSSEGKSVKNKNADAQNGDDSHVMQSKQEPQLKPDIKHLIDIKDDDYFFICSKGTLENMSEGELMGILSDERTNDKEKRDIIVERTKENNDNHSAYLIHVSKVIAEEIDPTQPTKENKHESMVVIPEKIKDEEADNEPQRKEKAISWSMEEEKKPRPYLRYTLTTIAIIIFVGGLIYFMFAKSPMGNDNEQNIEMSTKPAPVDTPKVATPAPKPVVADTMAKPVADTATAAQNALAKKAAAIAAAKAAAAKAEAEKIEAEKIAAQQKAAAAKATTVKPTTATQPATTTTHTEPATPAKSEEGKGE